MHLSDGEIQSYQDQELNGELLGELIAHLDGCRRCRQRANEMLSRKQDIQRQLSKLDNDIDREMPAPKLAAIRLENRLNLCNLENSKMKNCLRKLPRPILVGTIVAVMLVITLSFPEVRAVANGFLELFRVETIQVIAIDEEKLQNKIQNSQSLETLFSDNLVTEELGKTQEFRDAGQVLALSNIPVRILSGYDGKQLFLVHPGGSATFTVDLDLLRAVLKDLEMSQVNLPDSLDGAKVRLEWPTSVESYYGDCAEIRSAEEFGPESGECVTLFQSYSPTISAPPDMDLTLIGQAYLQLLGMTPEEAQQFAQNVDWKTTFLVPIPKYGTEYKNVNVAGTKGTLIIRGEGYDPGYVLIWIKDNIIYALSGDGRGEEALALAESLQ